MDGNKDDAFDELLNVPTKSRLCAERRQNLIRWHERFRDDKDPIAAAIQMAEREMAKELAQLNARTRANKSSIIKPGPIRCRELTAS